MILIVSLWGLYHPINRFIPIAIASIAGLKLSVIFYKVFDCENKRVNHHFHFCKILEGFDSHLEGFDSHLESFDSHLEGFDSHLEVFW